MGAHGDPLGPSKKWDRADGGSVGKATEAKGRNADPEGADGDPEGEDAYSHRRGAFRVGGMGAPEGQGSQPPAWG